MNTMKQIPIAMLVVLSFTAVIAHSEEIKIPIGSQTAELNNLPRPTLGMSKNAVTSRFGNPIQENPAKGKPPISSWEYADFVVYFENDHVIHSVLKPKRHAEQEITVHEKIIESTEDVPPTQEK